MRETPLDPNRCAKRIYQHWGAKQCTRKPMAGSEYCKQHDPNEVKQRTEKKDRAWRAQMDYRREADNDRARRSLTQPALLAACEELLKYPSSAPAWVLGQVQDAIKAARGKA